MLLPPIAHESRRCRSACSCPRRSPSSGADRCSTARCEQFLADVFWGDLDVLLLDLPPGTGDIAISVAQLLPHSELVIVTTPQVAAAEVAERAGAVALQTRPAGRAA